MKVAFLAPNLGTVSRPWTSSGNRLMEATGHNIGNMAFWYASDLLVDAEKVLVSWDTKASRLPKDIGGVVIPAANFINPTAKLDGLATLVRDLDVPVLLLGIGAQAEREDKPPERNDSVVRFLEEVSKRTHKICVRGDFSAKVCADLGITNTAVLGCPSILINPSQTLGETIERRIGETLDVGPYAIHASCVKHILTNTERELVRLVQLNPGSAYVVQRPIELIKMVNGEALTDTEATYFARCVDFFGFERNRRGFDAFLKTHLYAPTSVDSWMYYLRRFTAGINTRIHGTIMGTGAGIPSLCINHDTRTRELSKRLCLPNIEAKDYMETRFSVTEMFKRANFSGEIFDNNRRSIAQSYIEVFEKTGIPASGHLRAMAAV